MIEIIILALVAVFVLSYDVSEKVVDTALESINERLKRRKS